MPQGFVAQGISKSFGALQVLNNVSLTIAPGETVGLLGPNGAGKTTFVNILTGYDSADSGTISLDGAPLDKLASHLRAHKGLSRTFQSGRLFAGLTVAENIALGALGVGASSKEAELRTKDALELLDLMDIAQDRAGSVSHGNARLVGLARAVTSRPKYLVMDEPAAGINEHESPLLLAALQTVSNTLGCGMLLVEHNVQLVVDACSRIIVLATGNLIYDGEPKAALLDPAVKSAYLGDMSLSVSEEGD